MCSCAPQYQLLAFALAVMSTHHDFEILSGERLIKVSDAVAVRQEPMTVAENVALEQVVTAEEFDDATEYPNLIELAVW